MEFKKGNLVKVIANTSQHNFEIGKIIRVVEAENQDELKLECLDGHDHWWLKSSEIKYCKLATIFSRLMFWRTNNG